MNNHLKYPSNCSNLNDSSPINNLSKTNDELLGRIVSHLDVITLSKIKSVFKIWKELCKVVINQKTPSLIKPSKSKKE